MKFAHHTNSKRIMAAMFAVCVAGSAVFADTITLEPTADTGLFQNAPNNNLGAQSFVPVGRTAVGTVGRGLLRFDFAGQIPANATITGARLTLTVVFDRGGSQNADVHRMLRPWSEGNKSGGPGGGSVGAPATTGEATWNRREHPSTNWGSPGAQAGSDYVGTASATARLTSGKFTFSSAGLVADVQAFVSNGSTNLGWLFKNQSESTSGARRIGTREDSSNGPTLEVDFTVSGGTPPMTITSSPQLPAGTVGSPYSFAFTVTNGSAPFLWSIASGTVPGGLALSSAGVLSGTPTNAGNFNFTVQVSDSAGANTNNAFTLTVNAPALVIDAASPLAGGTVGVAYSQTLTATGGQAPYNWSLASGTLPGGLVLSMAGVLSGTPTNAGAFNFTAQVADNAGTSTSKAFALTINSPALAITDSSPLPAGTINVPYAHNFSASGGMPPYDWFVASGSLPGGLLLSAAGALSGTPTNSGDFSFTVRVTDSANVNTSKAFALTISSPLRIEPVSVAGNQVSLQFTAQAGQPYAVESNGSLSSTNWQTLTNIAAQASATLITVTDSISLGERYYRVRAP